MNMENMTYEVNDAKGYIEVRVNATGSLREAIVEELEDVYGYKATPKLTWRKQNNLKQRGIIREMKERVNKVPVIK